MLNKYGENLDHLCDGCSKDHEGNLFYCPDCYCYFCRECILKHNCKPLVRELKNIDNDTYKDVIKFFIKNDLQRYTDYHFQIDDVNFHVNKYGRVTVVFNHHDDRATLLYSLLTNPRVFIDYKSLVECLKE